MHNFALSDLLAEIITWDPPLLHPFQMQLVIRRNETFIAQGSSASEEGLTVVAMSCAIGRLLNTFDQQHRANTIKWVLMYPFIPLWGMQIFPSNLSAG